MTVKAPLAVIVPVVSVVGVLPTPTIAVSLKVVEAVLPISPVEAGVPEDAVL